MSDMTTTRIRLLSYVVMLYMLSAFTWWTLLLLSKNKETFQARTEALAAQLPSGDTAALRDMPAYQDLARRYRRQERMVVGEALAFVATLLFGLFFIHRSYAREAGAAMQQRNFLLSITHELRSPIAAVRLVLQTLEKRSLSREQTVRLLQGAQQENERLHGLVDNLLLSARLETSYQPHYEEVDLVALLEGLLGKLSVRYPALPLQFDRPEACPPLWADRSGLVSIVTNLLENAIKYAGDTAPLRVALRPGDSVLTLEVADQGPGISAAERAKVFRKFYRLGMEDTRHTKGTGLGLYIVDQIVRAHGGRIRVSENRPRGTVFEVEFPCRLR
ncbi:MAG: hypothetical protein RLY31_56 [Bacteroidota bacterium]|jgi:signal transduction histidine kinase